jgi:hypothetical protein
MHLSTRRILVLAIVVAVVIVIMIFASYHSRSTSSPTIPEIQENLYQLNYLSNNGPLKCPQMDGSPIWVQAGSTGSQHGTSENPYSTLAQAEANLSWNILHILPGSGPLDGGITIKHGQTVRGVDPTSRPEITNTSFVSNDGHAIVIDGECVWIENVHIVSPQASGILMDDASNVSVKNVLITGHNKSIVDNPELSYTSLVNITNSGRQQIDWSGIHGQMINDGDLILDNVEIRDNHSGPGVYNCAIGSTRTLKVRNSNLHRLTRNSVESSTFRYNCAIYGVASGSGSVLNFDMADSNVSDLYKSMAGSQSNGIKLLTWADATINSKIVNCTFRDWSYGAVIPSGLPAAAIADIRGRAILFESVNSNRFVFNSPTLPPKCTFNSLIENCSFSCSELYEQSPGVNEALCVVSTTPDARFTSQITECNFTNLWRCVLETPRPSTIFKGTYTKNYMAGLAGGIVIQHIGFNPSEIEAENSGEIDVLIRDNRIHLIGGPFSPSVTEAVGIVQDGRLDEFSSLFIGLENFRFGASWNRLMANISNNCFTAPLGDIDFTNYAGIYVDSYGSCSADTIINTNDNNFEGFTPAEGGTPIVSAISLAYDSSDLSNPPANFPVSIDTIDISAGSPSILITLDAPGPSPSAGEAYPPGFTVSLNKIPSFMGIPKDIINAEYVVTSSTTDNSFTINLNAVPQSTQTITLSEGLVFSYIVGPPLPGMDTIFHEMWGNLPVWDARRNYFDGSSTPDIVDKFADQTDIGNINFSSERSTQLICPEVPMMVMGSRRLASENGKKKIVSHSNTDMELASDCSEIVKTLMDNGELDLAQIMANRIRLF